MSSDTRIMSKRKQNQLLQLILLVSRGTSRLMKWIFKERYELFLLKRKQLGNSLQTTRLKLKSNVEFLISAELNTAVDSDVGYDGAEFNSVLFPVSRNYCLSNMDKGFYK